jgi:hypothetical protein
MITVMPEARYQMVTPSRGMDGRWYIDANGGSAFSGTHLHFERERGNLREVVAVREVQSEEEIQDGDLVCFGAGAVTVWRLA